MIRNNDVCEVLVTKGDQALAAADSRLLSLAPGQLGLFNAATNLAVDPAATTLPKQVYFAVGIDTTGDGNTDEIAKSAGSAIQTKNIRYASYREYVAPQPMIVVLKDYTADCETEYGIKLEFRNQEIYRTIGYNQYTKTYMLKTSCCKGCEPTCPSGDANEITKQLKINILNDKDGLVIAEAIARQALTIATHGVSADLAIGDVVSDADLDAIMAYNATQTDPADYVYTDLQITTVPLKVADFCSVNLKYYNPRQTVIIPSKQGNFTCNGTLEVTQEVTFEEGAGIDIKQLEYYTKGFKESAYRVSALIGVADDKRFNAEAATKYDCFVLAYEQHSNGGWLEYLNSESTVIAVPNADATTVAALKPLLAVFANNADEETEGSLA